MKVLLICLLCVGGSLAVQSVVDYFSDFKDDVTKLKWAHGVTTNDAINKALEDKDIRMLQANVDLYSDIPKLSSAGPELKELITTIINHNKDTKNDKNKKGIKLDFLKKEAISASLEDGILGKESLRSDINFPLWIGAEVVKGPKGSEPTPPEKEDLAKLKGATFSMGWKTGNPDSENKEGYSDTQTNDMKSKITSLEIVQEEVSYSVRAAYAAESYDVLKELIQPEKRTLNIWSPEGDTKKVDVDKLRKLIRDNKKKVYVDVPKDLQDLINSARIAAPLITVLVGSFAFVKLF